MTEAIRLVCAANSKFALGLITALCSAVACASGNFNYYLSVVDGGLSTDDWTKLTVCLARISLLKGIQTRLERIPAAELNKSDTPTRRGSPLAYSRLSIPGYLKVPRLVYVDSDVLCLRGIEDFWTQMDHRVLVAARDPLATVGRDSFVRERLPTANHKLPYFNSGIIGINCERWNLPENQRKIAELLPLAGQFKYADQSLLNCAFFDEWREIPAINNQVLSLGNCAALDTVDPAANFHFVGSRKPWLSSSSSAYRHCANLLFDQSVEWISGVKPPQRIVEAQSMEKIRRKVGMYRFFFRSRGKEYVKILESTVHPEAVVDRLWGSWMTRCGQKSITANRK